MSDKLSILEKALILSYILNKQAIENMNVVCHELNVQDHPAKGRLKHRFENLLSASKKAFETVEKNIEHPKELLDDLEETLNRHWEILEQNT